MAAMPNEHKHGFNSDSFKDELKFGVSWDLNSTYAEMFVLSFNMQSFKNCCFYFFILS